MARGSGGSGSGRATGPDWKGGFHLVPEGYDEPTPLPLHRTVDSSEGFELGGAET